MPVYICSREKDTDEGDSTFLTQARMEPAIPNLAEATSSASLQAQET